MRTTRFSDTEMGTEVWSLGDSNLLRRSRIFGPRIGGSIIVGESAGTALGSCLQSLGPGAGLQDLPPSVPLTRRIVRCVAETAKS